MRRRREAQPTLSPVGGAIALAATVLLAAPASAIPSAAPGWVSICTKHGIALRPIGGDDRKLPGQDQPTGCHSACTLPRKSKLR